MTDKTWFDEISGFLDAYIDDVRRSVKSRNDNQIPIDTYHPHLPSVMAGLLARQATLSLRLAQSPPFWDGHVAPLVLRPMVECLITFKWIALDPISRANEYITYGLGQGKLQLSKMQEKLKIMEEGPTKERLLASAHMQEAWIISQRLIQFLDVNLGSWTGMSIRKMCDETGDRDLYDWWFVPHSSCSHNTWQHVSVWNTKVCKNPLHQEHRLSHIAAPDLTLAYVHHSAKFLSDLIEAFDDFYNTEIDETTLLERFELGLDEL